MDLAICKYCGKELFWDEARRADNGRMIPIDKETNQPHNCPNKFFKCNHCGKELFWDEARRADNGKIRPVEKETNELHNCPNKFFKCRLCGMELYWDESRRSKPLWQSERSDKDALSPSGKMIPIEKETNEPHHCPKDDRIFNCSECNTEFRWAKAPNGEGRPHTLDGKIHDCRNLWDDQGNFIPEIDEIDRQAWEIEYREGDDDYELDYYEPEVEPADEVGELYTEENDDEPHDDYRGDTNRPEDKLDDED